MSVGFNSNVDVGGAVYHVQTEDRGVQHPFVDTVVLTGGRVVHRRSASYQDLLGAAGLDAEELRARVERQHREVLDAVRTGALAFDAPPPPAAVTVRLCNPTSWLDAGQASLDVEVLAGPERQPAAHAEVQASIEDEDGKQLFQLATPTGPDGRAQLRFRMPSVADGRAPVLIIRARGVGGEGQIRYRLKARPRDAQ